jgi:hypothetical protein
MLFVLKYRAVDLVLFQDVLDLLLLTKVRLRYQQRQLKLNHNVTTTVVTDCL